MVGKQAGAQASGPGPCPRHPIWAARPVIRKRYQGTFFQRRTRGHNPPPPPPPPLHLALSALRCLNVGTASTSRATGSVSVCHTLAMAVGRRGGRWGAGG